MAALTIKDPLFCEAELPAPKKTFPARALVTAEKRQGTPDENFIWSVSMKVWSEHILNSKKRARVTRKLSYLSSTGLLLGQALRP